MVSLFGGRKADHPMADAKEARRILAVLPAQDLKALEELSQWQESASLAAFKPAERLQVAAMIDEAAQLRLRKLARDYFATQRPSRYQENLIWTQAHEYWRQAGLAWARAVDACLQGKDAKLLSTAVVRAIQALSQQLKWKHLRYGPTDPAVWGVINKVYAAAEARGVAEARTEFLKAVVFSAASPDGLLPGEIELAEKVVNELAPGFVVAAQPARELIYWIDLGQPMAPTRVAKPPQPAPGLRLFGPGTALKRLHELAQRIEATRQLPSEISLGAGVDPEAALGVVRHLALYWAPEPPARKHPRHSVKSPSQLAIAHGFEGVVGALGGNGGSLDFDSGAAEKWTVENVSAGGIGAIVPKLNGDWLRVGTLLAMQPDGGANWVVGLVRRMKRTSGSEARVGIETLSRAPSLAKFALRGVGEHVGVMLPSPVVGSAETAIALRAGIYARGQNLETEFQGRQHVFMPQGAPESGEDYELVKFRGMVREA